MEDPGLLYSYSIYTGNFECGNFFACMMLVLSDDLLMDDSANSNLREDISNNVVTDSGRDYESLVGRLGSDVFVMSPTSGTVSIINFDPEEDKIDLRHFNVSFKQVIDSMQEMLTGCTIRLSETKVIEIERPTDPLEKVCKDLIKEGCFIKLLPELTQTTYTKENSVELRPKFNQPLFINGYPNELFIIIGFMFVVMTGLIIFNTVTITLFQSFVDDQRPVGVQSLVNAQSLTEYIKNLQLTEKMIDGYYTAAPAA